MKNKKGFTLIELLVVILIIGILAAVALPQYYKSKEKAEAVELQIMVKALYESRQRYYMVHNTFAKTFDELDMDYSGYERGGCEHLSAFSSKTDCFSNGKNTIHISRTNNVALRKTGKYRGAGFMIRHESSSEYVPANKLLCYEYGKSGFCSEVFNCIFLYNSGSNNYYSCKF